MADKSKIAEMLEHLVNNETEKAEELFHEYVVEKSRDIYENLIESEIEEASDEDEDDEDKVKEASEETNEDEDDLEEGFEDLDVSEADDETDDFMSDVSADDSEDGEEDGEEDEFGGEEDEAGSEEPATKGDLEDIKMSIEDHFAELEAAFQELAAGEGHEEPDADNMGGPSDHDADNAGEFGAEEGFELETVREYTEKIGGATYDKFAKGGDNGANTKSIVAGKNDMGGTTANIAKGGEGGGSDKGFTGSKPQVDDAGNVNKVGGTKTGSFYSKDGKGHGAEKAGAKESGTNTASIFRK